MTLYPESLVNHLLLNFALIVVRLDTGVLKIVLVPFNHSATHVFRVPWESFMFSDWKDRSISFIPVVLNQYQLSAAF